jgi:hypothetical protein
MKGSTHSKRPDTVSMVMQPFQGMTDSLVFIKGKLPMYAVPGLTVSSEEGILNRLEGFSVGFQELYVCKVMHRVMLAGQTRRKCLKWVFF